jgi:hypothetical protein
MGKECILNQETSFVVLAILFALLPVSVQLNRLLRLIFGESRLTRLRDALVYMVILSAICVFGGSFEWAEIEVSNLFMSISLFLATKVCPYLLFFLFVLTLMLFVDGVLRRDEYDKLGDYPLPVDD